MTIDDVASSMAIISVIMIIMVINMPIINISIRNTHGCIITGVNSNILKWQSHYDSYVNAVGTNDDASMDEVYVTYVDDEHVDNHAYDDTTDDEHDNGNDIYSNDIYGHIAI